MTSGVFADVITIVRDGDLGPDAAKRRLSWVEVTTTAGEVIRGPVRIAPGHWEIGGMPWADLHEKFSSIVAPRLGTSVSERVFAIVRDLEDCTELGELGELLMGSRR